MKKKIVHWTYLFVFLFVTGCQRSVLVETPTSHLPTVTPQRTTWPTHAWPTSTPEQQGMDSGKLAEMFAAIQDQALNLHSLLVARNGSLVLEAYSAPYGAEIRHTVESNTKSIIAALIGIAIAQGKIQSAEQRLVEFFPERIIDNLDAQKKAITLRDLLSMTPGLDCEDRTPAADGMYATRVWVQYLLDLPMIAEPGKKWSYCSGASHLLSAVLQKATGMDARSYANLTLFQPLGIPEVTEQDWGSDPQGVTNGITGLHLTPGELAKFGYLYLNKGAWEGRQVVPEKWVEESTREQAYIGADPYVGGLDRRFGYMLSLFPTLKLYGYLGMAGQELYVLPEKDLVVVFTASLAVGKEAALLELVKDYIAPSVRSDQPLPASAEATARLQSYLDSERESRQPLTPLPQTATDISGKTYLLDSNSMGWESMTFFFQPGADEALLQIGGAPQLKIGLDNIYRLTENPGRPPDGLRGRWKSDRDFYMEYIQLGEFPEAVATFTFAGDEIQIALISLNFGGQPQLLHGKTQK